MHTKDSILPADSAPDKAASSQIPAELLAFCPELSDESLLASVDLFGEKPVEALIAKTIIATNHRADKRLASAIAFHVARGHHFSGETLARPFGMHRTSGLRSINQAGLRTIDQTGRPMLARKDEYGRLIPFRSKASASEWLGERDWLNRPVYGMPRKAACGYEHHFQTPASWELQHNLTTVSLLPEQHRLRRRVAVASHDAGASVETVKRRMYWKRGWFNGLIALLRRHLVKGRRILPMRDASGPAKRKSLRPATQSSETSGKARSATRHDGNATRRKVLGRYASLLSQAGNSTPDGAEARAGELLDELERSCQRLEDEQWAVAAQLASKAKAENLDIAAVVVAYGEQAEALREVHLDKREGRDSKVLNVKALAVWRAVAKVAGRWSPHPGNSEALDSGSDGIESITFETNWNDAKWTWGACVRPYLEEGTSFVDAATFQWFLRGVETDGSWADALVLHVDSDPEDIAGVLVPWATDLMRLFGHIPRFTVEVRAAA